VKSGDTRREAFRRKDNRKDHPSIATLGRGGEKSNGRDVHAEKRSGCTGCIEGSSGFPRTGRSLPSQSDALPGHFLSSISSRVESQHHWRAKTQRSKAAKKNCFAFFAPLRLCAKNARCLPLQPGTKHLPALAKKSCRNWATRCAKTSLQTSVLSESVALKHVQILSESNNANSFHWT
jgi:hypothetical protein